MNSLRCTTLKQHFSAPPVHSSAHAPTPRPVFHFLRFLYTPRRFAVGFWVRLRLAFGFAVCYLLVPSVDPKWLTVNFVHIGKMLHKCEQSIAMIDLIHCDDRFETSQCFVLLTAICFLRFAFCFHPVRRCSEGYF